MAKSRHKNRTTSHKKDRKPTAAEVALFHETMGDVIRRKSDHSVQDVDFEPLPLQALKGDGRARANSRPSHSDIPHPKQTTAGLASKSISGKLHLDALDGIDGRTAERFRRGRMPIEAVLDLHGHTQAEAEMMLNGFLNRCQARGFRCVMVVTGKGKRSHHLDGGDYMRGRYGVLREALPDWLNMAKNRGLVLAVHTAQRQHGGSGAFYVLLKRMRQGKDGDRP